jgi:hypothetical protein
MQIIHCTDAGSLPQIDHHSRHQIRQIRRSSIPIAQGSDLVWHKSGSKMIHAEVPASSRLAVEDLTSHQEQCVRTEQRSKAQACSHNCDDAPAEPFERDSWEFLGDCCRSSCCSAAMVVLTCGKAASKRTQT